MAAAQNPKARVTLTARFREYYQTSKLRSFVSAATLTFDKKLRVKIKVTVAYFQVLGIFGLCFRVDWPEDYERFVREVNVIANLNPIGPVAASCVLGTPWTWHHTLLLKTAGTVGTAALLKVVAVTLKRCGWERTGEVFHGELLSSFMFLMYPSITATTFAAFVPLSFDDGGVVTTRYLAADLSIEYDSDMHRNYQAYAIVMILIWPLGVPLYTLWIFIRNREGAMALATAQALQEHSVKAMSLKERSEDLRERSEGLREKSQRRSEGERSSRVSRAAPTSSSQSRRSKPRRRSSWINKKGSLELQKEVSVEEAMEMLVDPTWMKKRLRQYEPRVFYFDLIECLRKLCLVGLSVFFQTGSSSNLAFGVLVTTFFLCVTMRLEPYILITDDILAIVYQASLMLTLVLAIVLQSARDSNSAFDSGCVLDGCELDAREYETNFSRALIVLAVAPIGLAVLFALHDVGLTRAVIRWCQRGKLPTRLRRAWTSKATKERKMSAAVVTTWQER